MSQSASQEALELSSEILADLELDRLPLSNCFMKASRLARLLGDSDTLRTFQFELEGYPSTPDGIPADIWALAEKANRVYKEKDKKTETVKERCYTNSIESLESAKATAQTRLELTELKPTSISSANPNQYVRAPMANIPERNGAQSTILKMSSRLAARRTFLYGYVLNRHNELRVSSPAEDIFGSYSQTIDELLSQYIPEDLIKIDSISDNISSKNPEDWANAAHTCRRLLQALADNLHPPTEDKIVGSGKNKKTVKLGPDNYINRLVCFCEENNTSGVFNALVGSHLSFIGNRLDSIFSGVQKGSHSSLTQEEAKRIIIFSYLAVGDILKLAYEAEKNVTTKAEPK